MQHRLGRMDAQHHQSQQYHQKLREEQREPRHQAIEGGDLQHIHQKFGRLVRQQRVQQSRNQPRAHQNQEWQVHRQNQMTNIDEHQEIDSNLNTKKLNNNNNNNNNICWKIDQHRGWSTTQQL